MRTRWLFWVVIGIYAVSFVLPAYVPPVYGRQAVRQTPGVQVFLLGPLAGVGWLANPAFWGGAYFCARRRWSEAVWAGVVASLLALSFIVFGGSTDLGLGYYVWLASMVLLTGVGLIGLLGPTGRGVDSRIPEQKR